MREFSTHIRKRIEEIKKANLYLEDDFRLSQLQLNSLKRTELGDVRFLLESIEWLLEEQERVEGAIQKLVSSVT